MTIHLEDGYSNSKGVFHWGQQFEVMTSYLEMQEFIPNFHIASILRFLDLTTTSENHQTFPKSNQD